MKKVLVLVGIGIVYLMIGKITTDYQVIPKEAIRIRVIGNSNQANDQTIKKEIKSDLEQYYYQLLKDVKGVDSARDVIEKSIPEASKIVSSIQGNDNFTIQYGKNYFPEKEYKGILYEEGYYESLVVTLGKGSGKNWWCVLFPPLCLIDEETDEVEYRSLVVDLIQKYF